MKRQVNPDASIDRAIEQAWSRLAGGVQVMVLDIPRIFRDIKLEVSGGEPLDNAVLSIAGRYRKN
jgi:hypothetical protein